jgi:putative inorganic carbon (hco3(-)) transporter
MSKSLKRFLPATIENPVDACIFLALAASISLTLLSIAISQIFLAAAIIGYLWSAKRSEIAALLRHPVVLPLAAFIIWTIIASLATPNPVQNFSALKKLFLYILPLLIPAVVRKENQVDWMYKAVFAASSVACIVGIVQFLLNPHRGPLDRIKGTMSHWMTYSGLLMLVFVMLMAYVLYIGWRKNKWIIPLAGLLVLVLILTQTRNAWIGVITAAVALVLLKRPRARLILAIVFLLAAVILLVYLAKPEIIQDRLITVFNLNDPRIEIFPTSLRLIHDHPWFGVGIKNVNQEALNYRGSKDLPDWAYQHMHNNFFQIAAERGIPGLIIWMWFMLRLAWDALRVQRSRLGAAEESLMISTIALGAWVAFIFAGLFEYNFGDTEVLTLFLFIMGAPYVFRRFPISDSRLKTPAS